MRSTLAMTASATLLAASLLAGSGPTARGEEPSADTGPAAVALAAMQAIVEECPPAIAFVRLRGALGDHDIQTRVAAARALASIDHLRDEVLDQLASVYDEALEPDEMVVAVEELARLTLATHAVIARARGCDFPRVAVAASVAIVRWGVEDRAIAMVANIVHAATPIHRLMPVVREAAASERRVVRRALIDCYAR